MFVLLWTEVNNIYKVLITFDRLKSIKLKWSLCRQDIPLDICLYRLHNSTLIAALPAVPVHVEVKGNHEVDWPVKKK